MSLTLIDEPWKKLTNLKNLRNCYVADGQPPINLSFTVSQDNIESVYEEHVSTNEIVTSTPQKIEGIGILCIHN